MSNDTDLKNTSLKALGASVLLRLRRLKPYAGTAFIVLLALMYGFILLRINTLSNVQPDTSAVDSQTSAARIPKVNAEVAEQLRSLEDSSVNVRTLFDRARGNPFTE